jgi:SSS family solute:Na+ symporter
MSYGLRFSDICNCRVRRVCCPFRDEPAVAYSLQCVCRILSRLFFTAKKTRKMWLNLDAHTFPNFWEGGLTAFSFKSLRNCFFIFMRFTQLLYDWCPRISKAPWNSIYIFLLVSRFTSNCCSICNMGGLKGVMYTDALQGSLMLLA